MIVADSQHNIQSITRIIHAIWLVDKYQAEIDPNKLRKCSEIDELIINMQRQMSCLKFNQ